MVSFFFFTLNMTAAYFWAFTSNPLWYQWFTHTRCYRTLDKQQLNMCPLCWCFVQESGDCGFLGSWGWRSRWRSVRSCGGDSRTHCGMLGVFSSTSALTHISEVKGSDSHTQEQMWVVHSGSRIFFYLQMLWFTCISVRLFIYCINTWRHHTALFF